MRSREGPRGAARAARNRACSMSLGTRVGGDRERAAGMEALLTWASSVWPWLLAAVAILAAYLLYSTAYAPYRLLRQSGIAQGPTPIPFLGCYKEVNRLGFIKFFEHLYEKYGAVVGFCVGRSPMVMVADLDMVKQITVTEFDHFMDRQPFPDLLRRKAGGPRGLLSAKGEAWRKARQTLSPSFSALKMKMMLPLIKNSCDTLVEILGECRDASKSVDVFRIYGQFTMETILATAFGRVVNIQRGEADKLADAANVLFAGSQTGGSFAAARLSLILSNFPWMLGFFRFLASRSKRAEAFRVLEDTAAELVRLRRADKEASKKYKDLLQLMINASVDGEPGGGDGRGPEDGLSDKAIVAHSATFLLAGYETTANTLAYTSYLLALHPDIQERLRTEIDDYFHSNPDTSLYEAIQDLQYLDMVVQESLRLYPPATRAIRGCRKTTDVCGVTIPKGALINFPIHLFHHLPDYWPEPYKFDPERFTPEEKAKRPQLAFMPFGWGPRNCIGMRFALMEAKLALIEVLRKYKFVRSLETQVPLETVEGITMAPKNGIYLKIVSRD